MSKCLWFFCFFNCVWLAEVLASYLCCCMEFLLHFCCKPGKGSSDLYPLLHGFLRSVSFIVTPLCFWLFKSLDIIFQVSLTRSMDMIVAFVIMDM
jgi:hypothetical protein